MDTLGDATSWPSEGPDGDDAPRYALSHVHRQHVTLENIELLAELDEVMKRDPGTDGTQAPSEPPSSPTTRAPADDPGARSEPVRPTTLPADDPGASSNLPVLSSTSPPSPPAPLAPAFPVPSPPRAVAATPVQSDERARAVAWVVPAAALPAAKTTAPALVAARPRPSRDTGDRAPRARWARPADRWLLEALAVAGASGAFVVPSAWLTGLAAVSVVGGALAFRRSGHSLWSLPGRALRRTLRLLHPRSLVWAPVLAARTAIGAVVLSAGVAAVVWLVDEGTATGSDGLVAAARLGAWADGLRVAVALVCVMLLTSIGDGRQQRATTVRRWTRGLPDGGMVALAVASLAIAGAVVVGLPHPDDRFASRADGLGWVPAGLRAPADRLRDDVVTAELDALASCLSNHTDQRWRTSYSAGNALDDRDVARLVANAEAPRPTPGDLATAVVAAHNLLAPWVETIEVRWVSQLVRVEREGLPHRRPITEVGVVAAAASAGDDWLDDQPADAATVLRCSSDVVL